MLIDSLLPILIPPPSPVETGSEDEWLEVNQLIGVRPPEDFVCFVRIFGTGTINHFLTVLNPFAANPNLNLLHQIPVILATLRTLKEQFPPDYPFPLFYEPGGFLPWGISDDGDLFGWATTGLTGCWSTIVLPDTGTPEYYSLPFSQFLLAVLTGSVRSAGFPVPLHVPEFTPLLGA